MQDADFMYSPTTSIPTILSQERMAHSVMVNPLCPFHVSDVTHLVHSSLAQYLLYQHCVIWHGLCSLRGLYVRSCCKNL
jgi:hypothetical protein